MSDTNRTSLFLMANLGAEVSRIISAKDKGDVALMEGALHRADSMLREIRILPDIQPRMSEIDMLSEVIHSLTHPTTELRITPENIKSYFTPFALRMMSA